MDVSWNYSVITSLDPGSLLIIAGNDQYSGQDRREIPSFVRLIRLKYHAKLKKLNAQTVLLLTAIQLLKFCNWFMKHFQNIFHPPPLKKIGHIIRQILYMYIQSKTSSSVYFLNSQRKTFLIWKSLQSLVHHKKLHIKLWKRVL